ncbi:MAG: hypothetical protein J6X67_00970 [Treponema sp.]|nr:hypothetical protein [Treponema sp.]
MKLRMATLSAVVAIITLFATACGGGGGGGDGDNDYWGPPDGVDDSGYDHPFGGMREGYYIKEPDIITEYNRYQTYIYDKYYFYLKSDGAWSLYSSGFKMDGDERTDDRYKTLCIICRYTVEEDGLHLLSKSNPFDASDWGDAYTVTHSDDTSFTIDNKYYVSWCPNGTYTFSETPPSYHEVTLPVAQGRQ